ncbi:MAG: ATP-dependent Clp protease proteolytic subunit [Spirochaetales bacterium]|nr:ATP-dependent Clp protease proteolytic subunit [Spirochaetales bacterium]
MKSIHIEGVIGCEVYAADLREQLKDSNGEDIDLTISSPGGSVYEGLAIYNTIRDFRKAGGKVNARVIGLAASMATYISLAANTVSIEDNAIWMIHNPWNMAIGNQNDMRKMADLLEGIAVLICNAYAKKTGKEKSEIRELMDAETYLFGEEIKSFGFADSIEPAGEGAETKAEAVVLAHTSIEAMKTRISAEPQQIEKAAALLTEMNGAVSSLKPDVIRDKPAATAEETMEEVKMQNLEELKNKAPDLYTKAVNLGEGLGIEKERARVSELRSYIEADPDNLKLAEVVNTAIADGSKLSDVNAKVQVAIRDGSKLEGENAPSVQTAGTQDALSAEEISLCKNLGITPEEYKAQKES